VIQTNVKCHVNRLRPFQPDGRSIEALANTDHNLYEIESIQDHSGDPRRKRIVQFRVRWKGYGEDYGQWVPYSRVRDAKALDDYIASNKSRYPELSQLVKRRTEW
jgi:hypothetical protein